MAVFRAFSLEDVESIMKALKKTLLWIYSIFYSPAVGFKFHETAFVSILMINIWWSVSRISLNKQEALLLEQSLLVVNYML
mmetsp:Transcript_39189/g.51679  ORF Transcript_39189/g.51679 Transcript_39189/m.51679 type:complete len:81 (+) Transcript_39189:1032-1274(+)